MLFTHLALQYSKSALKLFLTSVRGRNINEYRVRYHQLGFVPTQHSAIITLLKRTFHWKWSFSQTIDRLGLCIDHMQFINSNFRTDFQDPGEFPSLSTVYANVFLKYHRNPRSRLFTVLAPTTSQYGNETYRVFMAHTV